MIFEKSIKFMSTEETLIFLKSSAVLLFVWLFDYGYKSLLSIHFINSDVRDILLELKELIGFVVSFLVLIITIIKLKKLVNNKKEKE
jgi:hypothetical protein